MMGTLLVQVWSGEDSSWFGDLKTIQLIIPDPDGRIESAYKCQKDDVINVDVKLIHEVNGPFVFIP